MVCCFTFILDSIGKICWGKKKRKVCFVLTGSSAILRMN